jgi:uncharacterized protein (TIGR02246 family)
LGSGVWLIGGLVLPRGLQDSLHDASLSEVVQMIRVPAKKVVFAFISLVLSSSAYAQVRSPEQLPEAFIKAWNSHDPTGKGFAEIFADDAHFLPVPEIPVIVGGKEISSGIGETVGNQWAKDVDTALKGTPLVHRLRPDVAVIYWRSDLIHDGRPVDGIQRANIFVAVHKAGEWRITDFQITKQNPDNPDK